MIIPDYIEKLTDFFSSLPGIGNKTATRLSFHILSQEKNELNELSAIFQKVYDEINFCQLCAFFAKKHENLCSICSNHKRNERQILVVENKIDVMAIEELGFYNGRYHILGGLISPLKNVLPDNLNIKKLGKRLVEIESKKEKIEIILGINTNIEGEATTSYLINYIQNLKLSRVEIFMLARGLPTGADLDYTDKDTLQNSFINRNSIT